MVDSRWKALLWCWLGAASWDGEQAWPVGAWGRADPDTARLRKRGLGRTKAARARRGGQKARDQQDSGCGTALRQKDRPRDGRPASHRRCASRRAAMRRRRAAIRSSGPGSAGSGCASRSRPGSRHRGPANSSPAPRLMRKRAAWQRTYRARAVVRRRR